MKTVGEFKSAGLVFVEGDTVVNEGVTTIEVMCKSHAEAVNFKLSNITALNFDVKEFAWRQNTGVKPDFVGAVEFTFNGEGCEMQEVRLAENINWQIVKKWRPSLNQPHKWPSNSRMDIIGQNGNDGLHYDNTAQQVESLAVNDKPIFTQAMVDAGELPPVGSTVIFDAELANDFEYEYENGLSDGDRVDIIAHLDTGKSVAAVFSYSISRGKLVSQGGFGCFKPVGTRTDREKAIDEAMADIDAERDGHANVAGVVERMIAAGYSKC